MSLPEGAVVYAVPMRTRFRGIDVREGVLLPLDGGWTEWSPFWDYGPAEARTWWAAAQEDTWPAPVRDRVPVNCTVPAVGPDHAAAAVHASGGCRTAKVKVCEPGQRLADDLDRVAAVRDALGPGGRVRVDANGGWTVDEAVDALVAIDRAAGGLEYAEQPCAAVEDLARVRRRTHVPVAADESIRRSDDPFRVVALEAADVAVVKVQPLGGVARTLRIAQEIGIPVVVSSALETSVGLAAGVAAAAALPDLPFACGLNTALLLGGDPCSEPLVAADGAFAVRRPTPDRLDAVRADADTTARWAARLRETLAS